jgi:hypothetical protein
MTDFVADNKIVEPDWERTIRRGEQGGLSAPLSSYCDQPASVSESRCEDSPVIIAPSPGRGARHVQGTTEVLIDLGIIVMSKERGSALGSGFVLHFAIASVSIDVIGPPSAPGGSGGTRSPSWTGPWPDLAGPFLWNPSPGAAG